MTKRHVDSLLLLAHGVLLDAVALDKSLSKAVERDYSRLSSLCAEHGIAVFTVMLPAIAKLLDRSLDTGRLELGHLPLTRRVSKSSKIPRLFSGIWMRVFDESGCLRCNSSADPTFVFILRQLLLLGKKVEVSPNPSSKFKLLQEFYDVESRLPPPHEFWRGSPGHLSRGDLGSLLDLDQRDLGGSAVFREILGDDHYALQTCQHIADRFVSAVFDREIDYEDLQPRHGPGATSEYPRGRGYKYSFPTWSRRLEESFPFLTFGVSTPEVVWDRDFAYPAETDLPSRLVEVPKDGRGPRLIAAEPTANQWIQQGIARYISEQLRRHEIRSIDFRRQDISGDLALRGSLDGSIATVDLKAASDRLSCWLVQRLFRGNLSLLRAMEACRTRYLRSDLDAKNATLIELRKFATMGSALTFPVQSVSFLILCISAVVIARGLRVKDWKSVCQEVQVYGDDLIVPVDALPALRSLLSVTGLAVNHDKTFGGGNFRESCGTDAFRGYDVTPVKPKLVPESSDSASIISAVDVANLLHRKGLWHAAAVWRSLVREKDTILLTGHSGRVWGDRTFCSVETLEQSRAKTFRFSSTLHRVEVRALQPKAVRRGLRRFEGYGNLLQFFVEEPVDQPLVRWSSGEISTSDAAIVRRWVALDALNLRASS